MGQLITATGDPATYFPSLLPYLALTLPSSSHNCSPSDSFVQIDHCKSVTVRKDLLLRKEEITDFDHVMDMKELMDEENEKQEKDPSHSNSSENKQ
jgi:hypothetical protein